MYVEWNIIDNTESHQMRKIRTDKREMHGIYKEKRGEERTIIFNL